MSNKSIDEKILINKLANKNILNFLNKNKNKIQNLSKKIINSSKQYKSKNSFDKLIHEFDLTSNEGVALMCLAEALLRIPDKETIDKLIEDKIPAGNWQNHISNEKDIFVNISSLAFLLTGKLVKENDLSIKLGFKRIIKKLSAPILRQAISKGINILAKQFVFAENIETAINNSKKIQSNRSYSFDMLGEAAITYEDSKKYLSAYEKAIIESGNSSQEIKNSISVKLSSLHPRYERSKIDLLQKELLPTMYNLVKLARDNHVDICFDAEEADRLNLSLFFFKEILNSNLIDENYSGFGFAIQAYQKRSFYVVKWLQSFLSSINKNCNVRLVKGAYWDTEIKIAQEKGLEDYPVFTKKFATDISYLACAHLLRESHNIFSQFATHNANTIAYIKNLFSGKDFEFQKLHGMGDEIYHYFQNEKKIHCRVYAPIGSYKDLLPYLVRRLLENSSNTSFVHKLNKTNNINDLIEFPFLKIQNIKKESIPKPANIFEDRKNSKGIDLTEEENIKKFNNLEIRNYYRAYSIINGQDIKTKNKKKILSPIDNKRIGEKFYISPNKIKDAAKLQEKFSFEWINTDLNKRCEIIEEFSHQLEIHTYDIVEICCNETGKTIANGVAEVREAVDFCRYYIVEAKKIFNKKILIGITGEKNEYFLRGKGLTFTISPWNFPIAIFTGQIVASLLAGNTVMAKPAEQASYCAYYVTKLLLKSGLPPSAISLLLGDGKQISNLALKQNSLKNILFTGSLGTAKLIEKNLNSKEYIPTFVAETGGLNCMIIDSSALAEHVVKDVISSGFDSAGQRCSACRVFCIDENIYLEILRLLKGAMETLSVGDPRNIDIDIGPVIDKESLINIKNYINKSKNKFSIKNKINKGNFIPPTIIEIKNLNSLKKEIFGPVVHILKYKSKNLKELCLSINSLGFGLTLGIHSRIDKNINDIVNFTDVGNIYINKNMIGAVVGVQPFGGYGKSGTGPKAGGPEYLKRLCLERSVSSNTTAIGGNTSLLNSTLE